MKKEDIKYYQNNPCLIVRDVNKDFCEIQLNVHFAANIESEYYCTPSELISPMGGGDRAREEYEQAEAIISDIQDEEHSIVCMVEKRLLHEEPIEVLTIKSLSNHIEKQKMDFEETKVLHEEWRSSIKSLEKRKLALDSEINALKLSTEAAMNIFEISSKGVERLQEKHNKLIVEIGYGTKKICMQEYQNLVDRDKKLTALEAGGVDNWEWYEESLKSIKE